MPTGSVPSGVPRAAAMTVEDWPDGGVYQLHLRVSAKVRLTVGRLGRFTLAPGDYIYTGRAARALRARVRRHLRLAAPQGASAARQHWHIDYLLACPQVSIKRVVLASTKADDECPVNQAVTGANPIPRFGASDCRARCGSHLRFVRAR